MAGAQTNPILRFVRRMAAARGPGDEPDRRLLEHFVNDADEDAFQALVRRHGPVVLSVCTRVLNCEHDAEDAFQATFLVFVRKAGSIRTPELLGPWLYGVAYRTALKAKAEALKRRKLEKRLIDRVRPPAVDNLIWHDLRPILDDEVNRLPPKYRAPFVLCYLEGKTNEQTAQILGCPQGTVFSRLAWARERLRRRLSRRGITLSAGAFAAFLAQDTVSAAVPAPLVASTSKAALAYAAGRAAAAGKISAHAAALAEGVLRAMYLTKLKITVVMLLAVGGSGIATGVLTRQAPAGEQASVKEEAATQPAAEDTEKPKTDKDKLQGTWVAVSVEDQGKKIPEEDVKASNVKMVFAGDKVMLPIKIKGESKEVGYKLDPTKDPKQIDLLLEGEEIAKAIYLLDGDTLKLCVEKEPGGERPSEFAGKEGTTHFLIILRRKK